MNKNQIFFNKNEFFNKINHLDVLNHVRIIIEKKLDAMFPLIIEK